MIRDAEEAVAEVKWLLSDLQDDLHEFDSSYSNQHEDLLKDLLAFLTEQIEKGIMK